MNDTATRNRLNANYVEEAKEEPKVPPKPVALNENTLMDLVFSFIGVSSNQDVVDINQTEKLNMFAAAVQISRQTAGTTTTQPGNNENFNIAL